MSEENKYKNEAEWFHPSIIDKAKNEGVTALEIDQPLPKFNRISYKFIDKLTNAESKGDIQNIVEGLNHITGANLDTKSITTALGSGLEGGLTKEEVLAGLAELEKADGDSPIKERSQKVANRITKHFGYDDDDDAIDNPHAKEHAEKIAQLITKIETGIDNKLENQDKAPTPENQLNKAPDPSTTPQPLTP